MYDQIARNRRDTVMLFVVMAILLGLVGFGLELWLDLPTLYGILPSFGLAIVMGLFSYYAGSSTVLSLSGARKLERNAAPQLFNVVEEMCIAAGGLPMPALYLIEDSAPNAFATGRDPQRAAIAVTRGLLDKLNRDELQGVIAHEIAHVRNQDILLAMMMAVLVGTVALLCDGLWRMIRFGGRGGSRRSGGHPIILVIVLLLALLAPVAAKIIQMMMSQRREYLADATSALLTRYPAGLASALQKISQDREVLEVANRATQHMYIINPIKSFEERAKGLFSTHPPTQDRIKRLIDMGARIDPEAARARSLEVPSPMPVPAGPQAVSFRQSGSIPGVPLPLPGLPVLGAMPAAAVAPETPARKAKPSVLPCARCAEPLTSGRIGSFPASGCPHCGGVWIGTAALTALLKQDAASLARFDKKFANLVGKGWKEVSAKGCPQCRRTLREVGVQSLAGLHVDHCQDCESVWFDDGELELLAQGIKSGAAR